MTKKLQKYVFIVLLVLLPTQLGKHFWPEWAYVSGIRVDYFSPTIYVTDLLIFLLLALEIYNFKFTIFNQFFKFQISNFKFLAIALLIFLNIYQSLSPAVSLYKWLKVAEFGFLAWFVAKNSKLLLNSYKFLLIPIVYESVLAIWQFWQQGSIGGWWSWLGERTFSAGTPGIAQAAINGVLLLRPYGTLPHPNVLAGFLILATVLAFGSFPHISRKIAAVILGVVLVGLVLTFSRVGLAGLWRDEINPLAIRQQFNKAAIEQFVRSPIWGTGLGTAPMYKVLSIKNYALVNQPTHNIYLLILAETGMVGLGIFLLIIFTAIRRAAPVIRYTLYIILVLGLFDHYFLTLQQGQLLLVLVLGAGLGARQEGKKLLK